jgi:glycosyltransferase involved in cell wall biosynthesis
MRANRCGFRAALANHAFVYHVGERSFSGSDSPKATLETRNLKLLTSRYPEYEQSVGQYLCGGQYQAERLLTGLVPDDRGRLDVAFDFSSVGTYHTGTSEMSTEVLKRAAARWTSSNIFVIASPEVSRFHGLDALDRVQCVPVATDRKFAVALRMAQPFSQQQLVLMSRLAPINVFAMLDPIAYDCLHLSIPDTDLEDIWGQVFSFADAVVYISDVVRDLFHARFARRPGLHELVTYLSFDFHDYSPGPVTRPPADGDILVVGNRFEHKRLPHTVNVLSAAFPDEHIVALGMPHAAQPNVTAYESGSLSDEAISRLFAHARVVVFPSVYEGFGIPIVQGLAHHRPVLARRTAVAEMLRHKTGEMENLILYAHPNDLVERLRAGCPAWHEGDGDHRGDPNHGWDRVADLIEGLIFQSVKSFSFSNLEARLTRLKLLPATMTPPDILEQHIQNIYASRSWRLTAPLRRATAWLRARQSSG